MSTKRTAVSRASVLLAAVSVLAFASRGSAEEDVSGKRDIREKAAARALPMASLLASVPDVHVETAVGHLPRLPRHVPGVYRDQAEGPPLRVIWPAPEDNRQVLEAGTYTVTGRVPGTPFEPRAVVTVKALPDRPRAAQRMVEPFPLGQVVLDRDDRGRDTPFIRHRDKFVSALAESDPDRFLYNFRDAFGQGQPEGVRPLGVWEARTCRLRGHASGHYLSAIAQACAGTTYDEKLQARFRKKRDDLVDTLHALSQLSGKPAKEGGPCNADPTTVPKGPGKQTYDSDLGENGIRTDYWNWGEGFLSAYPPDQFIMLEQGATYGESHDQVWAPYYTLHKILAGLLDCYEVGGNGKALETAEGMGTWVARRLKAVPAETRIRMWDTYIAGEYGGMNEVMARLHRLTGKPAYLECARRFDNTRFFFGDAECSHGLARNVDTLRGRHANQHIPQITGALETYRGTRDVRYYRVADNFWHLCTGGYLYSIGGVAGSVKNPECFPAQPDALFAGGLNPKGQNETCATYNLLKLSRRLFGFEPDGRLMDYYEQALINHILASVAEHDPGNTYHVPLNPGAQKSFGNGKMDGFTCCNGTALESGTKLQDSIYFRDRDNASLYVNLFVPSTLTWKERNVTIRQRTAFPYGDTTRLTLSGGGAFAVHVRVPGWAARGVSVRINGGDLAVEARPGTYLALERTWRDGDMLELRMPFSFRLAPLRDQPNIASLFYGPVLLAVQEDKELKTWRSVTLDAGDIGRSISGDPATLRFVTHGVTLKPFFETYGRHSVYLDVTLK